MVTLPRKPGAAWTWGSVMLPSIICWAFMHDLKSHLPSCTILLPPAVTALLSVVQLSWFFLLLHLFVIPRLVSHAEQACLLFGNLTTDGTGASRARIIRNTATEIVPLSCGERQERKGWSRSCAGKRGGARWAPRAESGQRQCIYAIVRKQKSPQPR